VSGGLHEKAKKLKFASIKEKLLKLLSSREIIPQPPASSSFPPSFELSLTPLLLYTLYLLSALL